MINGDRVSSWRERLLYFPQCVKQWNVSSRGCLSTRFVNLISANERTGTPSRRLCNMFWGTLNWSRVAEQIGGKVKVFDIACGAGAEPNYLGQANLFGKMKIIIGNLPKTIQNN